MKINCLNIQPFPFLVLALLVNLAQISAAICAPVQLISAEPAVLVRFRDGFATKIRAQQFAEKYRYLHSDRIHSSRYFARYQVRKSNTIKSMNGLLHTLAQDPQVLSVELDEPVFLDPVLKAGRLVDAPADRFRGADPQVSQQWALEKMGWFQARDRSPQILSKVTLAIADNAIDSEHPELRNRLAVNSREIPGNQIDDDDNGKVDDVSGWDVHSNDASVLPDKGESHGTHVAGIAMSEIGNGVGIAGVAPFEVKLLPIKVSGEPASDLSFPSLFTLAIDYAIERGATVMNLSYPTSSESRVFREALARAQAAGMIFVNSAGNSAENIDLARGALRSIFDNIIFVAASDSKDSRPDFSNYGQSVEIVAPGFEILSLAPKGRYQRMSGTSMAAPQVAASVAWIRAVHPEWGYRSVLDQLIQNSEKINWSQPVRGGRLFLGSLFF